MESIDIMEKEFEEIKKFIGDEIPEVLYHYTNLPSLHSILLNKEVWFSNLYFLNDKNEFELGLKLINEEIELHRVGLNQLPSHNIFLTALERATQYIKERDSPYILSLTKNKDLLSQWRGYTKNGVGVNIGFNKTFYDKKSFRVYPCIYDVKTQKEFIAHIVWVAIILFSGLSSEILKTNKNDENIDESVLDGPITMAGNYFMQFAILACALIKDSSFKEEEEWRIIYSNRKSQVHFLPQSNYLKPFVKIPIADSNNILKSITIGPNPEKDLCHLSITKLLKSLNITKITLGHSAIPYRN